MFVLVRMYVRLYLILLMARAIAMAAVLMKKGNWMVRVLPGSPAETDSIVVRGYVMMKDE